MSYQETKTVNYVGLSAFIHFTLIALVAMLGSHMIESRPLGSDVTIIEFEPALGEQTFTPLVAETVATEPEPLEQTSPPEAVAQTNTKNSIAQKASRKSAKKAVAVPAKNLSAARAAKPTAAPAITENDIQNLENELSQKISQAQAVPYASDDLNDAEVAENLESADRELNQNLNALAAQQNEELENQTAQEMADIESSLSEAESELASENEKLNQAVADQKSKYQNELSALENQRAQEQKAQALAAAAAARSAANTKAQSKGGAQVGKARAGEGLANENFGIPTGVRSLSELRQQPGNPAPRYDLEDRLQKREGTIVLFAYITKEGTPTKFKLNKTTGHRSLDAKTLQTLKKWKFLPGQEGWVELPFQWSLKGGAKEYPSGLRTKKI